MAAVFATAAGPQTRLPFAGPEGWTAREDPASHTIIVAPPNAKAAVTFAATRDFAGNAEQWQHQMWTELLQTFRLAAPSQPGTVGPFLTRMGVIQSPDGSRPWICLYSLVDGGRGEAAIYVAGDEKTFMAHLATVNQMLQRQAAGPPQSSQAGTAPVAIPAGNSAGVAGLYLATTRQLRFSATGSPGSADWETRTEFYLLSADGQVFRGRDLPTAPGGDINRFDYAAARREAPGNYGSFAVRGNVIGLRFSDESIDAKQIGADALEIRGTKFTRSVRAGPTAPSNTPVPPDAAAPSSPDSASIPVLAYNEPPGFYRSAIQPPTSYTSNETNAGYEVYPFRPFTGDIVATFRRTLLADAIAPQFREQPLAGTPQFFDVRVNGATTAVAARFHENNVGQLSERMRLLVVVDHQAALVDLHASSSAGWQRVGPALGALVDSLRVERRAPPPSLNAGPGPDAGKVVGLFMALKSKYMAGLSGLPGTGGRKSALHYYVFSADGRVYCCYDFPPGGSEQTWQRFDFDAAQRTDPDNTGRYRVEGNQLLIQMSAANSQPIAARITDANHLEIEKQMYERQ